MRADKCIYQANKIQQTLIDGQTNSHTSAKPINPDHPVQTPEHFPHVKGPVRHVMQLIIRQHEFYQFIICHHLCINPYHTIPSFNPFLNKPWFLRVFRINLLKTLWEKEKSLVTSNFSFSLLSPTCLENFLPFSANLKLSANSFSLDNTKICRLGKG